MFFISEKIKKQTQITLLNKDELIELRGFAEQLDCSPAPSNKLESRQTGYLPTTAIGSGMDYAESRLYQAGDDTRSINWRLSARSHETFVKTFHIESRPAIGIFLDKRRSMIFGTKTRLKVTQAIRVAVLLAIAAEQKKMLFQGWILDNEAGLQFYDNPEGFIYQANHLNTKTTELCNKSANKPNNKPVKDTEKTQITAVLQTIYQKIIIGSLVYLISDFSDLEASNSKEIISLHEHCFVQALQIQDHAELNLPRNSTFRLQDMQENRSFKLNTQNAFEHQAYQEFTKDYFLQKKQIFKNLGISYTEILTNVHDVNSKINLPLGQA